MFLYVIIGFFAAVGLLFLLWLLRGLCLPAPGAEIVAIYCRKGSEHAMLRRYRWMRDMGLTRSRIALVESALSDQEQSDILQNYPGVIFLTPEQWLEKSKERLEANG